MLQIIFKRMGQTADAFDHINDRPGGDKRYAIDAGKIQRELGWRPQYTDFSAGLDATIEWCRTHSDWWEPAKAVTEKKYRLHGH